MDAVPEGLSLTVLLPPGITIERFPECDFGDWFVISVDRGARFEGAIGTPLDDVLDELRRRVTRSDLDQIRQYLELMEFVS